MFPFLTSRNDFSTDMPRANYDELISTHWGILISKLASKPSEITTKISYFTIKGTCFCEFLIWRGCPHFPSLFLVLALFAALYFKMKQQCIGVQNLKLICRSSKMAQNREGQRHKPADDLLYTSNRTINCLKNYLIFHTILYLHCMVRTRDAWLDQFLMHICFYR